MYLHMYVCMALYAIHTYIRTVRMYYRRLISVCMHVCISVYVCVYHDVPMYLLYAIHTYMHKLILYVCIYIYIYIYIYVHTYIYAYIHISKYSNVCNEIFEFMKGESSHAHEILPEYQSNHDDCSVFPMRSGWMPWHEQSASVSTTIKRRI
jgi:hypothetical protein